MKVNVDAAVSKNLTIAVVAAVARSSIEISIGVSVEVTIDIRAARGMIAWHKAWFFRPTRAWADTVLCGLGPCLSLTPGTLPTQ